MKDQTTDEIQHAFNSMSDKTRTVIATVQVLHIRKTLRPSSIRTSYSKTQSAFVYKSQQ